MSLPFCKMGEPDTTVVNRGQHFCLFSKIEANNEVNYDANDVNVRLIEGINEI